MDAIKKSVFFVCVWKNRARKTKAQSLRITYLTSRIFIVKKFKKVLDRAQKNIYTNSTFQGGEGMKNLPNVLFLRVPNGRAVFPFCVGAGSFSCSKWLLKGFFIIYKGR